MIKVKSEVLVAPLEIVCEFVDDLIINFTKEGMTINQPSAGMISFVKLFIDIKSFDEYDLPEGPFNIRVNSDELIKRLKRFSSCDSISLRIENENNTLVITDGNKDSRSFDIELLADRKEEDTMTNFEETEKSLPLNVRFGYSNFSDIVADLNSVSESKSSPAVLFSKKSSVLTIILKGYKKKIILNDNIEVKSKYGLELITKAMKRHVSDIVSLSFGTDTPIVISHNTNSMSLKIMIAPRVSDD